MKNFNVLILLNVVFVISLSGQAKAPINNLLSESDFGYLKELTKDVLESSRIYPGQIISPAFGSNNTGGILIRPGGRDCYPSFWIRDYAMSLECGFITSDQQKHMLQLTASTQCDQTWITNAGSMIPLGAIADHIRIDDSKPIYFPGTYDYHSQGGKTWGVFPPYCDQYFFIHMAYYYVKNGSHVKFLLNEIDGVRLIDRLEMAYKVPPTQQDGVLVYTTDDFSESTSWERSMAGKNSYQNGAYWGTPTGWVCYALAQVDVFAAKQLAKEYIDDLRAGDYRKGPEFGAPWECYNADSAQNAVYLTSVSCPYIVFKKK